MMHELEGMNVRARTADVLEKLKTNREQHKKIVEEARAGYVKEASAALKKRLSQLDAGKAVDLFFHDLKVPVDHSKVYDTAIEALSWHQSETIALSPGQIRNLIMDEWDWTRNFLLSNAGYSGTAATVAAARGLDIDAGDDDLNF